MADEIKLWFDAHPNIRIVFKYLVIGGIGGILYVAGNLITQLPAEWFGVASLIVSALNEKYKLLSPLEPWPVIGSPIPPHKVGKKK
jgi:hypothetical protein